MGETKYFLMEVDKLIPYARNARTHSEVQIAQIAASIKEFGFLSPVIISKDNTILCLPDGPDHLWELWGGGHGGFHGLYPEDG